MTQLALAVVALAIGLALMLADMWAQGIGVALAGLVGPPLVRNPDVMAVTTLALAPVQVDLGGGITPLKVWAVLAMVSALFESLRTGEWRLPSSAVAAPFAVFALWVMVGETVSMTVEPGALMLVLVSTFVQLYMVWRAAAQPGGLRKVGIGYAVLLLALAASIPLMPASVMADTGSARSAGLCGEPNWAGETAARILPFAVALLIDRSNSRLLRILGAVAVVAALYCEFASASRGGTLAMVAGMAAFALATSDNPRSAIRGMALLSALAAALLYLAPEAFAYRVLGSFGLGTFADAEHGDITSGRLQLNSMAIEAFSDSPWFGLGANGWQFRNQYLTGTVVAIHNGPLSGLVAFGLPAAVAYALAQLLGLVQFVRTARAQSPDRIYRMAAFAHLVAVLVSSQSLPDIMRNLVWVAPALVVAGAHALKVSQATAGQPSPATAVRLPERTSERPAGNLSLPVRSG
ncbi:MAG: O-antigen ligase family protein [Deltaproteobacteria bacterium]|nr:O-antigen ligase family protein [Deltaproteobacteria bacterium]